MDILIIIGNFYPIPSSVANCSKGLIRSLIKDGHNIHLVTNLPQGMENMSIDDEGIQIHGIADRHAHYMNLINRRFASESHEDFFMKLFRRAIKLPFYLRYNLFAKERRMGGWSIKRSVSFCLNLNQTTSFDLIISISLPFTAHLIAYNLKKHIQRKIPWLIYEYDPYYYNIHNSKSYFSKWRIKRQETSVFGSANKILVTPELFNLYADSDYSKFLYKMEQLPYYISAQFLRDSQSAGLRDNSHADYAFMYAGGLYTDIRNPLYAMKLISKLDNGMKFLLLTNYDEYEFMKMVHDHADTFILKDKLDQRNAITYMKKARFLVSIGNTVKEQVPAKIFEYMSLGKPIIHFSKIQRDPALEYLKTYPLVLVIHEFDGNSETHLNLLKSFVQKHDGKYLDDVGIQKALGDHSEQSVGLQFSSIVNRLVKKQ